MEKVTVVKTIVLEELANGNGERAELVLKNLGQLDILLGVNGDRYKAAVLEIMEATLLGLLKENNPDRQKLADLGLSLVVLTSRLGYEVYECLFRPVQFEYHDLTIEEKYEYEKLMPVAVIQAGARIVAIKESENIPSGMDRERFLSTAKTVLLHLATKAGPETKVRAIEALANFEGSEVKKNLDVLVRNGEAGIKRIAEDSIAMIREREDLNDALNHEKVFVALYPYEGDPKRFFISMVYDSVRVLMPAAGDRKIADSAESAAAIRQLVSLIKSAPEWKKEVFGDEIAQAEILEEDIQNALFHVIKRSENNGLRKEAAGALAANRDERAITVFKKILERRESGFELVGKYTIQKPAVQARSTPPAAPRKKAAAC